MWHYFLIIQQTEVNYSAYTTVTTPQDSDQMIYFKAYVQTFCLKVEQIWTLSTAEIGKMEIDHVPHAVERIKTVHATILSKAKYSWGVNHVVTGLSMQNVYD